jgi:2-(1,2-epoxy-1,2-dihydrophenyl)acetyl-CoA isomerase/putative hydratase
MSEVLVERGDGVTWVTLNRPDALNATTEQMHAELYEAFTAAAADPDCRVLVLTGAGDKAFCIGSDLGFLGAALSGEDPDFGLFEAYLQRLNRVVFALEQVPVPTIAMVQAKARASGFELAVACDLMLIADEARIGDVHTPYGHMPGAGATQRTVRKVGLPRALELLWTGRWLSAAEAVDVGLALRAVPADRLRAETAELAARLASMPGDCVRHIKTAVYGGLGRPITEGVAVETREYLHLLRNSPGPVDGFRAGQQARRAGQKAPAG